MEVEPRTDLAKATLADGATGVLVAATVAAAGLRPGINARLCAVWALWGVLCLAGMFLLRRVAHIGADATMAQAFCAILANAAERELAEALPPARAPRWAQLRHSKTARAPSWPSSEQPDASSGATRRP
jgi:hypothetical protein